MKLKFSFLNNLSIRSKLYIVASIIAFFLILTGFLSFLFVNRIETYTALSSQIKTLNQSFHTIEVAEKNFLLHDRNNLYFYQTEESENLQTIYTEVENSKNILEKLRGESDMFETSILNHINRIGKDIETFSEDFELLKTAILERGMQAYGKAGELENHGNELIQLTRRASNPYIFEEVSKIETSRRKYLLFKEIKHKNDINRLVVDLRKEIKNNQLLTDSITAAASGNVLVSNAAFIEALDNYRKAVESLVTTDLRIGISINDGMQGDLHQTLKELSGDVDVLNTMIEELTVNRSGRASMLLLIVLAGLTFIVVFLILKLGNGIAKPLITFRNYIIRLGEGELPERFNVKIKDELGEMAEAINNLTDNLKNTKNFVLEVGRGKLDSEVNVFNNKGDLGSALLQMRTELLKISEEREKSEQAERERSWASQGIARFSDILRQHTSDLNELGNAIIAELVKYTESIQGGLLLHNDKNKDDIHLELIASYAYNRRKYMKKKIAPGEGLIGTCAVEKQTMYLTELPEDYMEITSALGQTVPRNLLIVPLKLEEEILGVVELASMKIFQKYEIEFVEKVSESIAATFSSAKINARTAQLLRQSQEQAEELASKEEEMRQNMEELQATQEEAARKETVATGFVNSVNHTIIRADYALDGTLEYANTKFLELVGYRMTEIRGSHVSMFLEDDDYENFKPQWQRIIEGGRHIEEELRFRTKTSNHWVLATYTPVKDTDGNVIKILFLGIDIEKQKTKNLDYQGEVNAINRSVIKAEYDQYSNLINVNDMFIGTLHYKRADLKNKTAFSFISHQSVSHFEEVWRKIREGLPYEAQQKFHTKQGKEKWFQAAYYAIKNFDEEVYKIILIAYDITSQKQMELETREKNKELTAKEEELQKNLYEMRQVQEQMAIKNEELGKANQRAKQSEIILKKALEQAKLAEVEIKQKNEELQTQEEELRQNLEELSATQDEMAKKQEQLQLTNERMYKTQVELEKTLKQAKEAEKEIKEKNEQLSRSESELRRNMQQMQKVQKELKAKDSLMRGQLNAINKTNALAEYDMDGVLLTANSIFCELYGYVESDIKGRHHRMFVEHNERKSDNYTQMWNKLREGLPVEGIYKRITKTGTVIYLKSVYNVIFDADGKAEKVLSLSLDITESKLREEEMRAQLEALNKTNVRIEYDLDGTITTVNELFTEITGYEASEITGRHHRQLMDKDYRRSDEYKTFWLNLRKGIFQQGEEKIIAADNSENYWYATTYPVTDAAGNPIKIVTLATDITENKLQQLQLNKQTEQLKANEKELHKKMQQLRDIQGDMIEKQEEMEETKERLEMNEVMLQNALTEASENAEKAKEKNALLQKKEAELKAVIQEMEQKQAELKEANEKAKRTETILQKALKQSKKAEEELKETTQQLAASEEELRQNMEEMQATQEEMEKRHQQLESANQRAAQSEQILKKALQQEKITQQQLTAKHKEIQQQAENARQTEIRLQQEIAQLKKEIQQLKKQ